MRYLINVRTPITRLLWYIKMYIDKFNSIIKKFVYDPLYNHLCVSFFYNKALLLLKIQKNNKYPEPKYMWSSIPFQLEHYLYSEFANLKRTDFGKSLGPSPSLILTRILTTINLPELYDSLIFSRPSTYFKFRYCRIYNIIWEKNIKLFFLKTKYRVDIIGFFKELHIRFVGASFYYMQSLVFLLFVDACLTDDEPLWEPIEWSLLQTWILFIFLFGWIAENLITSRYGSYVGKDKRVWMSWYKTFWLIEIYYMFNFMIVACFIIVPFYYEINYSMYFVYSWWNWFNRVFFFKFSLILCWILLLSYLIQSYVRSWNWKKILPIVILINIFFSYLLYTHFIMSFFGYLTDPLWYAKTKSADYIQLSHEPLKWGFGDLKRDIYSYHSMRTVFWFRNDGPIALALLLFHLYFFLSLFFIYIYWVSLFRRIYSTGEVPLTYTTYCISLTRQFFYCFLMLYFFIFLSFIFQYWRLPVELFYNQNNTSWLLNFMFICIDYSDFMNQIYLCFSIL